MTGSSRRTGLTIGAGVLAAVVAAPLLLLSAVQGGLADGLVRQVLSARLGHPVSFAKLTVSHAADGRRVVFQDLRIADPPRFDKGELARVRTLDLDLRLLPLLMGRLEAPRVLLVDPVLHLRRRGPGNNNYSFGSGGASSFLGATRALDIRGGRLDMDDPQRGLRLQGSVAHDPADAALPLRLDGAGVLKDAPFTVSARGGPLNGRKPGQRHAIAVTLVDGATHVRLEGSTGKPFDFDDLDIDLAADGPNAGDLVYLFNLLAPNSGPFTLTAHMRKRGKLLEATRVRGRLGDTDFSGEVRADHSRPRRLIQARLHSQRLTARDLATFLASAPEHAVARVQPGRPAEGHRPSGRMLSPTPFSLARLQHNDIGLDYTAATATGFGLAASDVALRLDLDAGRLRLHPLTARVAGGTVRADFTIDTDHPKPAVSAVAAAQGVQVASLAKAHGFSGRLDAHLDAEGVGASLAEAAATAKGRASVRVTGGTLPKLQAEALQGDLFGLVGAALAGGKAREPLRCAAADFAIADGAMRATRLEVGAGTGLATGGGVIDLKREQLDLFLRATSQGAQPAVQLKAPITLTGPFTRPKVSAAVSKSTISLGGLFSAVIRPFKGGGDAQSKTAPGC